MNIDLEKKYDLVINNNEVINIKVKDLLKKGKKTIFYFYPKDNTPGCSLENKDFSFLKKEFKKIGINIVGVSKDSVESHKVFIKEKELNIKLLSDPELELHKEFLTYGEKNNYGKIVMGVIRSTFLISSNGEILNIWRNIRAKGHAERILKELKNNIK